MQLRAPLSHELLPTAAPIALPWPASSSSPAPRISPPPPSAAAARESRGTAPEMEKPPRCAARCGLSLAAQVPQRYLAAHRKWSLLVPWHVVRRFPPAPPSPWLSSAHRGDLYDAVPAIWCPHPPLTPPSSGSRVAIRHGRPLVTSSCSPDGTRNQFEQTTTGGRGGADVSTTWVSIQP